MNEFRLVIPGEPVAKARPKLGIANGRAMAFTPKRTRTYDDIVRNVVAPQWNGRKMLADVPIEMEVLIYRGIPASWPKKRQQAAALGRLRPIGRPDWDNFGKMISDGLNGVVYLDDSLIVTASVQKFYAADPRVEVTLRWPEADAPAAVAILQELSLIPPEPPLATRPRTPPPLPDAESKPF